MSAKQKKIFVGMTHVKDDYKNTGLSDTEFAKLISARTKSEYSCAEVRAYRATLGIAVNRPRDERDQLIMSLQLSMKTLIRDAIQHEGRVFSPEDCASFEALGVKQ